MKNTYKIIWSDEALNGLTNIIRYIENKFSEKDVKKFAVLFDKQIKVIQSFPESFPLSKKSKNIRKSVVAKLTSIYYSFDKDVIRIVSVFDNRMHQEKY